MHVVASKSKLRVLHSGIDLNFGILLNTVTGIHFLIKIEAYIIHIPGALCKPSFGPFLLVWLPNRRVVTIGLGLFSSLQTRGEPQRRNFWAIYFSLVATTGDSSEASML
ncbi:hypothetical protein HAX54_035320 [Datura stramonium]|uniref:Uncharacterized protein n=1 Tax=Datura stramonium TaxID=4076 RepID=A0ABS8VIX7_DATST|nr:hypothetical protein [Datura stramonium]